MVCVLHSTANQGIINGRASDYRTDSDYRTTPRIEKSAGGGAVCSVDTHGIYTAHGDAQHMNFVLSLAHTSCTGGDARHRPFVSVTPTFVYRHKMKDA